MGFWLMGSGLIIRLIGGEWGKIIGMGLILWGLGNVKHISRYFYAAWMLWNGYTLVQVLLIFRGYQLDKLWMMLVGVSLLLDGLMLCALSLGVAQKCFANRCQKQALVSVVSAVSSGLRGVLLVVIYWGMVDHALWLAMTAIFCMGAFVLNMGILCIGYHQVRQC